MNDLSIINSILGFFSTTEGITTSLVVLVLLLRLFINRKTTIIHFKRLLISIPSEITFLVIGFLLSKAITIHAAREITEGSNTVQNIKQSIGWIVLSLIILVAQYAVERSLDDKISGKIKFAIKLLIVFMYTISIALYSFVVFGG